MARNLPVSRLELAPLAGGNVLVAEFEPRFGRVTLYVEWDANSTRRCGYTAFRASDAAAQIEESVTFLAAFKITLEAEMQQRLLDWCAVQVPVKARKRRVRPAVATA